MKDFMMLVKGDSSNYSPEEMQKKLEKYQLWMTKWTDSGNYIAGAPFESAGNFILSENEVQSEGEFLNPTETIGGYIHIRARDLDHATSIAKECPLLEGCGIYVRPFLNMN